jgi:acyl-[acyl-carrier-protein]-phospholipid O-acyltransferase/long-chain-fatty-acid--[acyl-carrier-protein] ligase
MIADKSGAMILPIRIDGAQYSPLSRLRGKVRIRAFPKITLTILPPRRFAVSDAARGRARRQAAGAQLYDLMTQMMFESSDWRRPLFASLIDAQAVHGRAHPIAEDVERKPLSYGRFITRSFILAGLMKRECEQEQAVGLLLPSAVSTAAAFFGVQACGKTAAMLNFTAGASALALACRAAELKTVITSRRFVEVAKLGDAVAALEAGGLRILYLEALRDRVGLTHKLAGFIASCFPRFFMANVSPDAPAVILFTSGSEGTPKGVALSHANIQANRFQLASCIDFGPSDKVFNSLPMFHAFGLTGGTLLPMLSGIKTFFYPSPLHYRIVPELIYDTNATILFGTDTFLAGYARFAHPYDLHSIRYVFAGAEKLKEETRNIFADKFGVRIFEGYGATECAPVISTNTPMHNRPGTVGRFMPGMECRVTQVPGIEEGGQLSVRGPNVMLGYLYADKPGQLTPPPEGWYDTGDIVTIDEQGYIAIKGRTKRFAKIGGEMVSLTAVEAAVCSLWPAHVHAAVTVPDERKGEQIILLTTQAQSEREMLIRHFKTQRLPELAIPKRILIVHEIPLLGTGKTDYQSARRLALDS